jgi:hypothetical protein
MICMAILEDIEGWLAQKNEQYDDPKAYHENEHVKVITTTTKQCKSQQHEKIGAYAK